MAQSSSNAGSRFFLVGETPHLRVRVSQPGTKKPLDAGSVVLTTLRTGTTVVAVTTTAFTREAEGDYLLVLPTAGLAPGEYDLVITVSDGPTKVSILTDRFALRTP